MEDALAYLLELRLRCRGNPEATAIVDRCLALLARAERTHPVNTAGTGNRVGA